MKQQTAMQELLERLNRLQMGGYDDAGIRTAKDITKELLKKEEEQIKGIYLSYADVWDVDPTSGTSATSKSGLIRNAISMMQKEGLVSPTNVYGRIYFDPKTGKPILD